MNFEDISSSERCEPKKRKKSAPWTTNDDEKLLGAVKQCGKENWKLVAETIPTKTRKQCRERFMNCLSDDITKRPWGNEEDQKLLRLQKELGNKWTEISKSFEGRTPNSLKNRFFSHLHPEYRRNLKQMKLNKTPEEKSEKSETKPPNDNKKSAFVKVHSTQFEVF